MSVDQFSAENDFGYYLYPQCIHLHCKSSHYLQAAVRSRKAVCSSLPIGKFVIISDEAQLQDKKFFTSGTHSLPLCDSLAEVIQIPH